MNNILNNIVHNDNKLDLGSVEVDMRVFAEIISSVIDKVRGVQLIQKNLGNRLFELFGQKNYPGISVKVDDKREMTLDLKIFVEYGLNIPDIAREVQKTIKSTIDEAMDVNLKDINVNVQGIVRREE